MNQLSIEWNQSVYAAYTGSFRDFMVDGVFFGEALASLYPEEHLRGLVPPCSGWLSSIQDQNLFWRQIAPGGDEALIAPILICPDDQDFTCQTIVVEVQSTPGAVFWLRFGLLLDAHIPTPLRAEEAVRWFRPYHALQFSPDQYQEALRILKVGGEE